MSPATLLHLAAGCLLLALAFWHLDQLDATDGLVPPAAAGGPDRPPATQELHRMFDQEKHGATAAELPAQF
jgi:hypothetical protein